MESQLGRELREYFTNNGNFSNPAVGTFGTCPAQLGWLRGPGYDDIDLSLQKNVQITERYKVQFRTDFVNTFNHVNLNARSEERRVGKECQCRVVRYAEHKK